MTKDPKKRLLAPAAVCLAVSLGLLGFICYSLVLQRPDNIVNVQEDLNIGYLVFQKANPYIESPFLGMDENYLSSYTDYIKLDSNYECTMSERANLEYSYRALVVLVSRYKKNPGAPNNPEILEKSYSLDTESASVRADHLTVSRSYDLYLDQYKSELDAFAATIDLPVSNEVRIDFIVDLKSADGISSSFIRSVTIPVGAEFYNIDIVGEKTRANDYNVPARKLSTFMIIVLSILCLASFIAALRFIERMRNNKPPYRQEIDGYLQTYDDMVINTITPVNLRNYETISVGSFKELLNLAKVVNIPIMYLEEKEYALFYILNNNIAHLFRVDKPQ